jgi:5-methylcytosine-specific restriction endonuclease McrA
MSNFLVNCKLPIINIPKLNLQKIDLKNSNIDLKIADLPKKAEPKPIIEKAEPKHEYKTDKLEYIPIKNKYKKKTIPHILKRLVWNRWIGDSIGKTKCLCCKIADITMLTFVCGHIIAESKGGELSVNNLKPICGSCNSSMGSTNMDEYIKKYT